ncbi:hypothetical protein V2W45_1342277 [Cenococcum geophilum]
MGLGGLIEPLVVVMLLFGGTWINRNKAYRLSRRRYSRNTTKTFVDVRCSSPDSLESGQSSPVTTDGLLSDSSYSSDDGARCSSPSLLTRQEARWRKREIGLLGWRREVVTPNTRVFRGRLLSRLLRRFPFLVEAWYWALIYWVYQLGRAFTAVTLVEGTVHVARRHALQLIQLEQSLHIFHELAVQRWFLAHPTLLHWTNRIYSFIHIPGTILFLVGLYYYTTTTQARTRAHRTLPLANKPLPPSPTTTAASSTSTSTSTARANPALYAARRRTMATCNLLAFIIFTLWPCMPPRLLSSPNVTGPSGAVARSYGFVDTVHGSAGESSVWTQNRFCNQYAAMPSLHFGYALLIGLTVMSIPLAQTQTQTQARGRVLVLRVPWTGARLLRCRVPSWRRAACVALGVAYPAVILVAIVATANHFVLDAVAGAVVCGVAWRGNGVLLNLLPVEDWFLWCVRIHKPEVGGDEEEDEEDDNDWRRWESGKGGVV